MPTWQDQQRIDSMNRAFAYLNQGVQQGIAARNQAGLNQQRMDLALRNQMIQNEESFRYQQAARDAEYARAEQAEINRLKMEEERLGPSDPVIDSFIKTGSMDRLTEKMAIDPEFGSAFERIMSDPSLRPREKMRAIFDAEMRSSLKIATQQKSKTPQQIIEEGIFVLDMAKYGGHGQKIFIGNGKGGHIIDNADDGGSFGPMPQVDMSVMGFPPMAPMPDFGSPMPGDYQGPMPTLRPWKPEARNKRRGEIMDAHDGALSLNDAAILAEMDRYEASGVDPSWNPVFLEQHGIAMRHSEEVAAAKRKKLAGADRQEDPGYYRKPTTFESIRKEVEKAVLDRDAYMVKGEERTGPGPDWLYKDLPDRTPTPEEIDEIAIKEMLRRQRTVESINAPSGPTPGATPTPAPITEEMVIQRNAQLIAEGRSQEERRAILRAEGLVE